MILFGWLIFVFFVSIVTAIIVAILQQREKRKQNIPIKNLKRIEYKLKEYLKLSHIQQLEDFYILQRQLCKLYKIVYCEGIQYDKIDMLYLDQLHCDIGLIPYQNEMGTIEYFSPAAVLLSLDMLSRDKQENIDNCIQQICRKWLKEIPKIKNSIMESIKQ